MKDFKINLKYRKQINYFLNNFNDLKFIGQVGFVVVILLITWSGVKAIQTNYNLQKQIALIKQQNNLQKLQNDNQQLENQYYQTKQYLDTAARENLGLASKGEKEILVPKQVAMSYTVNLTEFNQSKPKVSSKSTIQNNFNSWISFFLHRANNT